MAKLDLINVELSDDHYLNMANLIGWNGTDGTKIHEMKNQLLASPNFFTTQTNLSGYEWLLIFQYLEFNGITLPKYYPKPKLRSLDDIYEDLMKNEPTE